MTMKHFVLTLAAFAVLGSQSAVAQNKVLNLSAETASLNVSQVADIDRPAQLSRYLFAGYNTLCLPMALTADQIEAAVPGAKIERLEAIAQDGDALCLYFADCTKQGVKAGQPYLIFSPKAQYLRVKNTDAASFCNEPAVVRKADGDGNQVTFSSGWTTRAKDGLYGIPAKQNVDVLESVLVRTTADQLFRPTRCGFNWEQQAPTAARLEIRHIGDISDVDGLKAVNSGAAIVDVYDLKGNIVLKQVKAGDAKMQLPAGVYIVGGEKVTVK